MDRSDITNQFLNSFRNSKKLHEIARSPDKLRNNLAIPLAYQKIRHWLPDILSIFYRRVRAMSCFHKIRINLYSCRKISRSPLRFFKCHRYHTAAKIDYPNVVFIRDS